MGGQRSTTGRCHGRTGRCHREFAPRAGNGFRWRNTLLAFANTVVPESTHVRGRTAEALAAQGSS